MNNTNYPLVSILVPVFQVEKYIERCAESIFTQTYNNCEFVFVDDGCTDSSIVLLEKIIDKYPCHKGKIIIKHHQQNRGLAATRNTAIESCHGDFVIHVDSDDWLEPTAIESLVQRQQETEADIVFTRGYYRHKEEIIKVNCRGWLPEKEPLLTNLLQDKATISIWSKLIKRRLYTENVIRCDERGSYYEDFQVLPRLIYWSKKIACLDDYIYHYERSNPNSIVTNIPHSIEIQKQGLLSIQVVCDFFHDKEREYFDLVRQFHFLYLYRMLNTNCRYRNKEGYNDFLYLLLQSERKDWKLIGWDNLLKRYIDHNYYLKILFLISRQIKQKADVMIKRMLFTTRSTRRII